ncbi:RING-H2 finger protein ATL2-like [Raphanus sativus]|nr:RING-H2 finger protein ATL2-like [Raphanus sativus]
MNSDEHNPMENWPGEDISDSQTYDANVRLTLLAIVTLSTLGIIMAFSYLYDRYSRSRHHARHNHQRRRTMFLFAADPSPPASVTPSTGLDPAVLKSLPLPPAATMTTVEEKGVTVIMISREPVSGRI